MAKARNKQPPLRVVESNGHLRPIKRAPIPISCRADTETVLELENLLKKAKSGEVCGIAVVAITGPKEYELMTTGEAQDRPTFTLGALTKFKLMVADMLGD